MLIGQTPPAAKAAPAAAQGRNAQAVPGVAANGAADAMILDGDQTTFMVDVIEASRSMPVLVDFWATWCGPCKTLTPAIERVVRNAGGRVRLVKIDIDANKQLVKQLSQLGLPLQSVPTVAAFWQGQIADMFQGSLPESEIKRFVEGLLKMAGGTMPAADLLAEARALSDAGDYQGAIETLSALIGQEPDAAEAWGALIRVLVAAGELEEARSVLDQVPPPLAAHADISGARSALDVATEGAAAQGMLGEYERRVAADADDHEARFELAQALNASDRRAEAADALLEIVRRDRAWREDGAKAQLLKLFEAWGLTDPATIAARRKLSTFLFR